MSLVEITAHELASAYCREVKQLNEGDLVSILGGKSDSREVPMIAATVAAVVRQQEGMVNSMSLPERDPIFVVLKNGSET